MTWRGSLVRISNYEVETLQKRLAEIVERRAEAEIRLAVMEAQAEIEIRQVDADVDAAWYKTGFLQAIRLRRTTLEAEIAAIAAEEAGARDALAQAFETLKKYEQVAEFAEEAAEAEARRKEAAAMDELGLRASGR